jgi:hypothetical protein
MNELLRLELNEIMSLTARWGTEKNHEMPCRIWGSYSSGYGEFYILPYNAV